MEKLQLEGDQLKVIKVEEEKETNKSRGWMSMLMGGFRYEHLMHWESYIKTISLLVKFILNIYEFSPTVLSKWCQI